jgi:hypothetical protein
MWRPRFKGRPIKGRQNVAEGLRGNVRQRSWRAQRNDRAIAEAEPPGGVPSEAGARIQPCHAPFARTPFITYNQQIFQKYIFYIIIYT